jgi:hypothetical protein
LEDDDDGVKQGGSDKLADSLEAKRCFLHYRKKQLRRRPQAVGLA